MNGGQESEDARNRRRVEAREAFDSACNSPAAWVRDAHALTACSGLLQAHVPFFGPAPASRVELNPMLAMGPMLLLRAFGLECLLKALWLLAGHTLARNGKYKGVAGVGQHDLAAIAAKVNLPVNEDQRKVLKRLTEWGVIGRYPVENYLADEPVFMWTGGDEATYKSIMGLIVARLPPGPTKRRSSRRSKG